MKEGIGGTFMIYVLLIFLTLYICFVAVAFNYARAFKVKNKIIDIIEQNEGIVDFNNNDSVIGEINSYLGTVSYNVPTIGISDCPITEYDYISSARGYCIGKVGNNPSYYKVKTFIKLEVPFLNIGFTIPVKGETRKIERINT